MHILKKNLFDDSLYEMLGYFGGPSCWWHHTVAAHVMQQVVAEHYHFLISIKKTSRVGSHNDNKQQKTKNNKQVCTQQIALPSVFA